MYAGDGSTDHLDEDVPTPKEIQLSDGQYELGREEPAQIVIPYPTVSSRHAMLRVGESLSCSRAPATFRTNANCATDGEEVSVTDLNSTNGEHAFSRNFRRHNDVKHCLLHSTISVVTNLKGDFFQILLGVIGELHFIEISLQEHI